MRLINLTATIAISGFLVACSQPEATTMVTPEPMFDKYGGGTCEEGYDYIPGTSAQPPVCVPDDGCIPVYDTAGTLIDCIPPQRQGGDGRDDSSTTGGRGTAGTGSTAP